jgi:Anthranilate/para-aminobenzoate synthases component I
LSSLFEKLKALRKSGKSFAYMCQFTDQERRIGQEKLFIGKEIVSSQDTSILDSLAGNIPVILSFSLVNSIYAAHVMESAFDPVMILIPENIMEGRFVRTECQIYRPMMKYITDADMEHVIDQAKRRILNGEMLQVVLSKSFGPLSVDPDVLLKRYMEEDRSMYVFYYRFGDLELFGSTPENLVSVSGKDIMIEPIAGTREVSLIAEENLQRAQELLSDPKELLEHRMLVDLARNDIGKIAAYGSVRVEQSMEVRYFSSVMHLVSRVRGSLRDGVKRSEVVNAVFPAGTVSGAPKDRALRTIGEFEQTSRGPYAGAVGTLNNDSMDFALTIRSIYGEKGSYYVRSGSGIVKDSIAGAEVREIGMKAYNAAGGALNEIVDH